MNRRKLALSLLGLGLALLLLAACAAAAPTPQPTSTPAPPAQWDLVLISDSSGWGVGKKYAEHIQQDLNVEVTLHDFAIANLSARSVANYLRDPDGRRYDLRLRQVGLAELLAEAEAVVLYANPRSADMGDWDCVSEDPYVVDCAADTFHAYQTDLTYIYDHIHALHGDDPIVMRAFDAYNPLYSVFREQGVYEACVQCWENYNQAIHTAAAASNVAVAQVFDAFNGPNHDQDPRDKGLIGPDGVHTCAEGSALIADLLRELGYEPTVR